MKNIIKDVKKDITTQFIGVITFGFGVTAFYNMFYIYITKNVIIFTKTDIIFLLLSIIGFLISLIILKDDCNIKDRIIKTFDYIITLFGFVSMFVPIIVLMNTTEINIIIYNCIYSLLLSINIFIFKSIGKYLIYGK
jgi:hypothetical protein